LRPVETNIQEEGMSTKQIIIIIYYLWFYSFNILLFISLFYNFILLFILNFFIICYIFIYSSLFN